MSVGPLFHAKLVQPSAVRMYQIRGRERMDHLLRELLGLTEIDYLEAMDLLKSATEVEALVHGRDGERWGTIAIIPTTRSGPPET